MTAPGWSTPSPRRGSPTARAAPPARPSAQLARAHADPTAALDQGLVAQLAAQGLVHPPGGDLHRVFTTARMGALAAEGTVRVYLVG
ncbi:MAG: hypothetical protein R2746_08950 [Acidimicrobiales bacterium]